MLHMIIFWWIIGLIFKGCFSATSHQNDDYEYDR